MYLYNLYMLMIIYIIALFCTVVAAITSFIIHIQFPLLGAYIGQSLFYTSLILLVFTRNCKNLR